ncbi:hypothetical protein FN846DRAFT_557594 [Sphaerosporella brunnea]|uniref:Uncharacterized protein n=1 Tax=Sphaerosporella brunnea TaxID=1250544 RepID=A0A5J5EC88_9PEZI|nr:hypothetical protein FN846DRAFT_557594 [Sphaerosporella brunnea]
MQMYRPQIFTTTYPHAEHVRAPSAFSPQQVLPQYGVWLLSRAPHGFCGGHFYHQLEAVGRACSAGSRVQNEPTNAGRTPSLSRRRGAAPPANSPNCNGRCFHGIGGRRVGGRVCIVLSFLFLPRRGIFFFFFFFFFLLFTFYCSAFPPVCRSTVIP